MQVAVVFKSPAPGLESNILNIKIQPTEGVYLQFNIKKPGETEELYSESGFLPELFLCKPDEYARKPMNAFARRLHAWGAFLVFTVGSG